MLSQEVFDIFLIVSTKREEFKTLILEIYIYIYILHINTTSLPYNANSCKFIIKIHIEVNKISFSFLVFNHRFC